MNCEVRGKDGKTRLIMRRRNLFVITAIVVAVLELLVLSYLRGWQFQTTDGQQYAENADSILSGEGYSNFYWAPGYSLYILLGKLAAGSYFEWFCVIGQFGMLVAGAVVAARLCKCGYYAPLIVFALSMFSPQLLNNASKLRNDTLCMFCLLPVMIGISKYQLSVRSLLLLGGCAGFACLVRNTALAVFAVCVLWILFGAIENTSRL